MDAAPDRLRALASWQLAGAARRAHAIIDEALADLGASRPEFAMLAVLDERPGLSQADLGRVIGLDRSDVTALVARGEAARLVARERDPADRRRNLLTLGPAGAERLSRLETALRAANDRVLAAVPPPDRERLLATLDRIRTL